MHRFLLLIGGNEGDRIKNINCSKKLIEEYIGTIINHSGIYESEPWGFEHAQNFLNQVIEIQSEKNAFEVLSLSKKIEKKLGRKVKTSTEYQGRSMDIDILFYDSEIINTDELIVPHPRLHERKFTLLPLGEKWKELLHPVFNQTISELLIACEDEGWVHKCK